MLNPFTGGFKVTKKGVKTDRFQFSWKLAFPIIFLFFATLLGFWFNLHHCSEVAGLSPGNCIATVRGINLGLIWSIYNLIILSITFLILIDAPKLDTYEWFKLRRIVKLDLGGLASNPPYNQTVWGTTIAISEAGMEIALTQPLSWLPHSDQKKKTELTLPVNLEIVDEKLSLQGQIVHCEFAGEFPTLQVTFYGLTLSQHRKLVELLFCRPGQWKHLESPGELRSLWLLFQVLLKPRFLCDRERKINAIAVSQI